MHTGKERIVLHCDINHCYAQIEEMRHPQLREIAMAVGGNEMSRHGIILAKNDLAREFHIRTGESLREAKQKCPHLTIVPPDFPAYLYYSEKVKDIYWEYSDQVEDFGIDEAWIDVSDSVQLFGDGMAIARLIQKRVMEEVGLTVSIGVSFNKIFAKLGSDLVKPNGIVRIGKDNFQKIAWPLAIDQLFYVGRATKEKLHLLGIETIGALACSSRLYLREQLGKMGELIWWFANGENISDVALAGAANEVKSVGNSITTAKNMENADDAKLVLYVLAESVASRLKQKGLKGRVICVSYRTSELKSFSSQQKIEQPTDISEEIAEIAFQLLKVNYRFTYPLRSIGISVSHLHRDRGYSQIQLFKSEKIREKNEKLDVAMQQIREKYGFYKVKRCCLEMDRTLTAFNPEKEHVIHPTGYF